jgi:hypothetical protein
MCKTNELGFEPHAHYLLVEKFSNIHLRRIRRLQRHLPSHHSTVKTLSEAIRHAVSILGRVDGASQVASRDCWHPTHKSSVHPHPLLCSTHFQLGFMCKIPNHDISVWRE